MTVIKLLMQIINSLQKSGSAAKVCLLKLGLNVLMIAIWVRIYYDITPGIAMLLAVMALASVIFLTGLTIIELYVHMRNDTAGSRVIGSQFMSLAFVMMMSWCCGIIAARKDEIARYIVCAGVLFTIARVKSAMRFWFGNIQPYWNNVCIRTAISDLNHAIELRKQ